MINLEERRSLSFEALRMKSELQSTFMGSPLEFAQFCYDQFNSEPNVKGILRRVVTLMRDWFGIDQFAYLTLDTASQPVGTRDVVYRFQSVKSLSDDQIKAARTTLQPTLVGDDEVMTGVFKLQAQGFDLCCAQFDEPGAARGVLLWSQVSAQNVDHAALFTPAVRFSNSELLDFLLRTAQQVATWLRRLDNAQSLLYQDEVTGLYNYRFLDVAIEGELRRYQRFQTPFSLLFIDLDNFKQVNDVFGHLTGSSVLRQVGAQIKAAVRDIDSVLRYGGDEFVVVLIGANSRQAAAAAERVRSRVASAEFRAEGSNAIVPVTTSIGMACCPDHGRDRETIIRIADEAMYQAKNAGKNRVIIPKHVDSSKMARSTIQRGQQP
jgi:diguanylate cyclase (GGDEF)-like protein